MGKAEGKEVAGETLGALCGDMLWGYTSLSLCPLPSSFQEQIATQTEGPTE